MHNSRVTVTVHSIASERRSAAFSTRPDGTHLAVELLESPLFQTAAAVKDRLRRPPCGGAPERRVLDSRCGLEFSRPRARRRGPFRFLRAVSRAIASLAWSIASAFRFVMTSVATRLRRREAPRDAFDVDLLSSSWRGVITTRRRLVPCGRVRPAVRGQGDR